MTVLLITGRCAEMLSPVFSASIPKPYRYSYRVSSLWSSIARRGETRIWDKAMGMAQHCELRFTSEKPEWHYENTDCLQLLRPRMQMS
ncbi:hypothetical protein EDB19DRAFT_473685 [Suillus lakei]|nr:hypothetical protein EDB19DRAFT_473685 [Suillus lakei]